MPVFFEHYKTDFYCIGIIGAVGLISAIMAIAGAA